MIEIAKILTSLISERHIRTKQNRVVSNVRLRFQTDGHKNSKRVTSKHKLSDIVWISIDLISRLWL